MIAPEQAFLVPQNLDEVNDVSKQNQALKSELWNVTRKNLNRL